LLNKNVLLLRIDGSDVFGGGLLVCPVCWFIKLNTSLFKNVNLLKMVSPSVGPCH
jgi:hypothetical protein